MKLNLSKTLPGNKITTAIPVRSFDVGRALILALPHGVAHKTMVVKDGANQNLVYGVDWVYAHESRHTKATYGLDGVGSIALIKNDLVGNIAVTADYFGGGYVVYDPTKVPEEIDYFLVNPPELFWDYEQDSGYEAVEVDDTLPGGYIKTSLADVADVLELFATIPPSGVDTGVVTAQVTPMVALLQDLTTQALTTTTKDVVGAVNEIIAAVDASVVSAIWGYEAKYMGVLTEATDLTKVLADVPMYYRVWAESVTVTYADNSDTVTTEELTYGDVLYMGGGNSNRAELIQGTEEPLTRLDRVDRKLATTRKDVVGAMLELIERTDKYVKSGDFFPTVYEDTDLTNYAASTAYQVILIGAANVTITGKFRDQTVSKAFTPEHVGILYQDGTLERKLLKDYPEAHVATIQQSAAEGDRTVSGQVKTVAKHLAGLGPQLGHLITVVNRGVAPVDSIDLTQRVVSVEDSSGLHALLGAAYGIDGANAILPPVPHDKPHGVFESIFAFDDSVINGLVYNPKTKRYLIHRVESGTWTFLTSYNAEDNSYGNLPTVPGIDIAPSVMVIDKDDLYMAQAKNITRLNLVTNAVGVLYVHPLNITTLAVNGLRQIAYVVDTAQDLYLIDLITARATKLESGIDKKFCLMVGDVMWCGKGTELIQYVVDKVIDRENRSVLPLGQPMALNTLTNVAISASSELYQLEPSGVVSKLGGVSDMVALTFDSWKWGFVGAKGGGLYALGFKQTLKNFIKE